MESVEIRGIQKERKLWVKLLAALLAVLLMAYELSRGQLLYVPIGLLVLLACFFRREHLVSQEGVDLCHLLFGLPSHSLWTWEEITSIHVDRKRAMPDVALHIGKDVATRLFVFSARDADAVLALAKEKNPAIRLGRVAGS